MVFVDFWLKTLEFPYGSSSGIPETGPVNIVRTGPDTTVNGPESDGTGRTLKVSVSGQFPLNPACPQKGSSHSGFLRIILSDFRI